jgi:hypothetical protein
LQPHPHLHTAQEPGTLLHSIQRVTYGPGEVPLYVHEGASTELCDTLEQLVDHPEHRLGSGSWRDEGPAVFDPVFTRLEDNNRTEAMPPSQIFMVFHLRPQQQQALPRLQGKTCNVAVPCEAHATVGDLYMGAAWYLSLSQDPTQPQLEAAVGQLRLVRGTITHGDLGSSLLEAGLHKGDVVHVLQQGQELPPGFAITIKTLTGKEVPMLVNSDMLVLELKQLVHDTQGIPPCQQRLIFANRQLQDVRTLGEYSVQEGNMVRLVLRLSAC